MVVYVVILHPKQSCSHTILPEFICIASCISGVLRRRSKASIVSLTSLEDNTVPASSFVRELQFHDPDRYSVGSMLIDGLAEPFNFVETSQHTDALSHACRWLAHL